MRILPTALVGLFLALGSFEALIGVFHQRNAIPSGLPICSVFVPIRLTPQIRAEIEHMRRQIYRLRTASAEVDELGG